jgi:VanZ family protein
MFNIKWLIVAVISTAVLILLTHLPPQMMPAGLNIKGLDKIAHFSAYAAITLFFLLSFKNNVSLRLLVIIFVFGAGLGILDELTQPFVSRTASVMDLAADISGIIIMLFLSHHFTALRSKQSPNIDM